MVYFLGFWLFDHAAASTYSMYHPITEGGVMVNDALRRMWKEWS
jgi:hypothetical protein